MRSEDKGLVRERLVLYMEQRPLPSTEAPRPIRSPFSIPSIFRAHHFSGALMIALLVTTGTFGMSFAADDALPGDFLYPVKVKMNEGVKTAFILSDEARITFERERAELRLREASRLASEGRLDAKRQATVSKLFAAHTDSISQRVQNIETLDPVFAAEVSADLETALSTHEAVLARLIVESEDQVNDGARDLIGQVRNATQEAGRIREGAEERIAATMEEDGGIQIAVVSDPGTTPEPSVATPTLKTITPPTPKTESANLRERATYRAEERARQNMARVEELLELFPEESELSTQSRNQLLSARFLVKLGDEALRTHDLTRAYGFYREAGASLQKVAQLLEVANLFSIEILPDMSMAALRAGDDADALDDRADIVREWHERVSEALRDIRTVLLTQEGYDLETVSQANARIKDATALLMRGEIAVILGDLAKAEALFMNSERVVTRAHEQLVIAGQQQNVRGVPVPEQPEGKVEGEEVESVSEPLTIKHDVAEGTHTFAGVLSDTLVGCVINATGTVSVTTTTAISIAIETSTDAEVCDDAERNFSVSVDAATDSSLVAVSINGVAQPFTLAPTVAEPN